MLALMHQILSKFHSYVYEDKSNIRIGDFLHYSFNLKFTSDNYNDCLISINNNNNLILKNAILRRTFFFEFNKCEKN